MQEDQRKDLLRVPEQQTEQKKLFCNRRQGQSFQEAKTEKAQLKTSNFYIVQGVTGEKPPDKSPPVKS